MKCKAIGRNMGRISIHGSGRGINGKWGTWGWEMSRMERSSDWKGSCVEKGGDEKKWEG